MAQRVSNIRVADGGGAYIIEFCDGTEEVLPAICCDDGTQEPDVPPANPETPSGSRCDLVYRYSFEFVGQLMNQLAGLGYLPDINVGFAVQLWMIDRKVPIQYYLPVAEWVIKWKAILPNIGEIMQFDYPEVLQAMYCCFDEEEGYTNAWIDCFVETWEDISTNLGYKDMVREFLKIFTLEYRNSRVFYSTAVTPSTASLCLDCVEVEPQGCSPELENYSRKFDHLTPELEGVRYCYPANSYNPCSLPENGGFNSVNANMIHITFGEFVCVKAVRFNFAGNGQVNWKKVTVSVKFGSGAERVLASNIAVVGRTNCQAGLASSFDMIFDEPDMATELFIRPTEVVGVGGITAPVTIHCVFVSGGLIPSTPV